MNNIDLKYLCSTIGNLSGIPIRIFKKEELYFYYSEVKLPKDPIDIYKKDLFSISEHVGYFITAHYHYYGIVNYDEFKIIIGPTRQTNENSQELRELAFKANVDNDDVDDFINSIKSIVRMPIESILQILCTINYVLNNEKKSLKDITIHDALQDKLISKQNNEMIETTSDFNIHNSYDQEQAIMSIVSKGDVAALKSWLEFAPAISEGTLAKEQLRQHKNIFIVSATLVSRAAIRGGMDVNDAFSISDFYIQRCELLYSLNDITNLQYRMILDYTERVSRLRINQNNSKLLIDVANYIYHHISEPIKTEDIANSLYLSRPYLSKKFKEETNENIAEYIIKEKINEAKRLLRYSNKSLTQISSYLGFSSPSHFSRVFKKHTNLSPSEYKNKHA